MDTAFTGIIGIYHADRGVRGHLRYVFDKVARGEGCALCDITHAVVREKTAFVECRRDLGVPLTLIYRDQLTAEMREATQSQTPAVIGVLPDGTYHRLLGPADLEAAQGDVYAFRSALENALGAHQSP